MPPSPHHLRGGADRLASLALYKALVGQCRRTPFQDEVKDELRVVLRNTFRKNRGISGREKVKNAFYAGYETLDVLKRANTGDIRASNSILHQLLRTPAHLTFAHRPETPSMKLPKHKPTNPPTSIKPPSTTPSTDPDPAAHNILARPRPLSLLPPNRPRHVPVFVDANGIPFLRTKKPVPNSLSAYISKRIARRQSRITRTEHFRNFALMQAEWEDGWDRIVRGQAGGKGGRMWEDWDGNGEGAETGKDAKGKVIRGKGGGKRKVTDEVREHERMVRNVLWTDYTREVVGYLQDQTRVERQKNMRMARAMKEVVAQEAALSKSERRERARLDRLDRKRKRAEKLQQDEGDPRQATFVSFLPKSTFGVQDLLKTARDTSQVEHEVEALAKEEERRDRLVQQRSQKNSTEKSDELDELEEAKVHAHAKAGGHAGRGRVLQHDYDHLDEKRRKRDGRTTATGKGSSFQIRKIARGTRTG